MKIITILILVFFSPSCIEAQTPSEKGAVRHWVYWHISEWKNQNDTIIGWFPQRNKEEYMMSKYNELSIGGKEYLRMIHTPPAFPILSRQAPRDAAHERRYHSIGIRRSDGKVLTDYEDFCIYLNYRFVNDGVDLPWNFSFGDPTYIPYHLTEDGSELILYDYTMEVGDSFRHVDGYDDITVVEKDTVAFADNVPRRRLTLSNGLVIIEGMGCINSNGMLIDWLNPAEEYQSNFTYLDYCADDWNKPFNVIYTHEDSGLHVVDTNPTGIESQPSPQYSVRHALYDLQGRRLSKRPERGVYIEDGRKYVVR
jgi:hypothetical protein